MGRGKLNRGEKGVSQLFQVKVEFGASVFVSNWVCLGLTLTSCEAEGVGQRLAMAVLVYTAHMTKPAVELMLTFPHNPDCFSLLSVVRSCRWRDDVSTLALAQMKGANRFLTTASLHTFWTRRDSSGAGLQSAETRQGPCAKITCLRFEPQTDDCQAMLKSQTVKHNTDKRSPGC